MEYGAHRTFDLHTQTVVVPAEAEIEPELLNQYANFVDEFGPRWVRPSRQNPHNGRNLYVKGAIVKRACGIEEDHLIFYDYQFCFMESASSMIVYLETIEDVFKHLPHQAPIPGQYAYFRVNLDSEKLPLNAMLFV